MLAAEIRAADADVRRSAVAMAQRALAAGAALLEAKAALPHGAWEDWIAANTGLSSRTARRYMQLTEAGMKSATVADLGIKGAAAVISRRTLKPAHTPGYEKWHADLVAKLDEAEAYCPGVRAGFIAWAKSQKTVESYAETLRRNCPDDELPALNAMIQAEQHRTLHLAIRRAHVEADHP